MNILVIDLLRIGDMISHFPIYAGLQDKYPQADIYLLTNDSLKPAVQLTDSFKDIFYFQRSQIQHLVDNRDEHLFSGVGRFDELLASVNSVSYDLVVNLSHTRLAGLVTGLILSKETIGLCCQQGQPVRYGSAWIEYLNDYVAGGGENAFHYNDIFARALGLPEPKRLVEMAGQHLRDLCQSSQMTDRSTDVVIQPFSADEKKEWSIEHWTNFISLLSQLDASIRFTMLCAPFELERAQTWMQAFVGLPVSLRACTLQEAFVVMDQALLTISVDTSIKHLAAMSRSKIVEISLGSSNYQKQGVYQEGALILQGRVSCSPCGHKSECTQATHLCGDVLLPDAVALAVKHYLDGDRIGLKRLSHELGDEYWPGVEMGLSHFLPNGMWHFEPLHHRLKEMNVRHLLERAIWKNYLDGIHLERIGQYGSASKQLMDALEQLDLSVDKKMLTEACEQLETSFHQVEGTMGDIFDCIRKTHWVEGTEAVDVDGLVNRLYMNSTSWDAKMLREVLAPIGAEEDSQFYRRRKADIYLKSVIDRNQVGLKIVRTVRSQIRGNL